MGEERVVALDRQHRLPRLDPVAVVERVDGERVPVVRAELEHGDRLVDPAEHRGLALEDLHHDPRVPAVCEQGRPRVVEVRVGVVPLAHLLDRELEDLRVEPLSALSGRHSRARDRRRERPPRPRAARGGIGRREALLQLGAGTGERARERMPRVAGHPAEDLDRSADRTDRAGDAGRAAHVRGRPRREDVRRASRGEQRADQVRAAPLVHPLAGSSCSYVPIVTCSAP